MFLALISLGAGQASAIDDGAYAGFYKVTFAMPDTGEQVGNTGEFVFLIEDNEIVDVQNEDEGWVNGKVKYKLKIDADTGKLTGHFSERGRQGVGGIMNLRWEMKGVFIDTYFAGEATIYITQFNGQSATPWLKVASYVFESP
jgi:hypothetical protein